MEHATQHLMDDAGTFIDPDGEFRTEPPEGYADTQEAWAEEATEFRFAYNVLTESEQNTITLRAKKQLIAAELIDPIHDALTRLRSWYDEQKWVGDYRVADAIHGLQAAYASLRLLRQDQHSETWHNALAAFRERMARESDEKVNP